MKISAKSKVLFVFFLSIFLSKTSWSMSADQLVGMAEQKPEYYLFQGYVDELYKQFLYVFDTKFARIFGMSHQDFCEARTNFFRANSRRQFNYYNPLAVRVFPNSGFADEIYNFARYHGFPNIKVFDDRTVLACSDVGMIGLDLEKLQQMLPEQRFFLVAHELAHEYYSCTEQAIFLNHLFCKDADNFRRIVCNIGLSHNDLQKLFISRAKNMATLFCEARSSFILFNERLADARSLSGSVENCVGALGIFKAEEEKSAVDIYHDSPFVRRRMALGFLAVHNRDRIAMSKLPVSIQFQYMI